MVTPASHEHPQHRHHRPHRRRQDHRHRADAVLPAARSIALGEVDKGTTDTDFDPEEQERGITIYSACVHVPLERRA